MRHVALSSLAVLFVISGAHRLSVVTLEAQGDSGKPIRTVKDGIMDEIRVYKEPAPVASSAIAIRSFSATDANLSESNKGKEIPKQTVEMQAIGPKVLAEKFALELKKAGPYTNVSVVDAGATPPPGAILVEGKFTELDPGSRAKRYVVGFGAGKSGVAIEGSVKAADGTLLATFVQRRIGAMGAFGGDSVGKMTEDCRNIGEDIAKFLSAWASNKKLK